MAENGYWSIYALLDPHSVPFYVGMTSLTAGQRLSQHKSDARRGKETLVAQRIRELGMESISIVEWCVAFDQAAAKAIETAYIKSDPALCNTVGLRGKKSRRVWAQAVPSLQDFDPVTDWRAYRQARRRMTAEL